MKKLTEKTHRAPNISERRLRFLAKLYNDNGFADVVGIIPDVDTLIELLAHWRQENKKPVRLYWQDLYSFFYVYGNLVEVAHHIYNYLHPDTQTKLFGNENTTVHHSYNHSAGFASAVR